MTWSPQSFPASVGTKAVFALRDLEDSEYPICPARSGVEARKGWIVGSPQREPFDTLLTSAIKEVVVALAKGRGTDADGGLARAASTYASRHPIEREYLDVATLNYLEFLEAREQKVGALTYIDYSYRRDVGVGIGLKLWSPVYATAQGAREVHRLRNGTARNDAAIWATGAAWIAGQSRYPTTVIEFGLDDGTEAILRDSASEEVIRADMDALVVPRLRGLVAARDSVPGSQCVGCSALGTCPAPITLDLFGGQPDATPWVRSVSESDLARYRTCPAKALAKTLHLPSRSVYSDAVDRGVRVHRWIAEQHAKSVACSEALLAERAGVNPDLPFLEAHASLCDRGDSRTIALEQTLVGWDAQVADVVFMKPDELLMRDSVLVLREIKTATNPSALEASVASDQYADVIVWWLAVLAGGLAAAFGATSATLELEVLTPEGGAIHRFESGDDLARFRVAGWRLDAPAQWLSDRRFIAQPGPQCAQCDAIRWCMEGQSVA